jgi:type I restriction enzyme S subunit
MFDSETPMIIAGYIIRVRLSEKLESRFISCLFNMPSIKKKLRAMAKGAVNQANINSRELASVIIPIPPLSLQQSFAQKVESIERQKELINQSIREAQTLFDSRMEYYFGE